MTETVATQVSKRKTRTLLSDLAQWPWLSIMLFSGVLFVTLFAPFLTNHGPDEINMQMRSLPPSWQDGGNSSYFLGTDTLGRDLLTRMFYGGRVSLQVAFFVLAIGGTIGLVAGIVAGYVRGIADSIIMRIVDSLWAIPSLLIALVFAITLNPSLRTVVIALSIVLWARYARVIRGDVLSVAHKAYIQQSKVAGSSQVRIMRVHILPNILNTFLIITSLEVGWVILAEATLSFLGAGIPPPTPSWGQMVNEGRGSIDSAWWISFFPGLMIAITVFSVNTFGDWLRDKLDPKLRQA